MEGIFSLTVREEIEIAVRLVLAAVFGAAVGYERRSADKPRLRREFRRRGPAADDAECLFRGNWGGEYRQWVWGRPSGASY